MVTGNISQGNIAYIFGNEQQKKNDVPFTRTGKLCLHYQRIIFIYKQNSYLNIKNYFFNKTINTFPYWDTT
jgi:hypothetical protein